MQNQLLKLEEENDALERSKSRLELTNVKLTEQLKSREEELEKNNQLLKDQAAQHKTTVDTVSSRVYC